MRRLPTVLAASLALAAAAGAQSRPASGPSTDGSDSVMFARARRLVSDGNGALGRALVDTLLAVATPGTPAYAEALYWRATLAERAADAERDYRQIAVEYASSLRAVDALVRLAQLDLVRGQPASARAHLARLLRDHADAPSRARAHYWLARAALDASDAAGACDALNDAAGAAEPGGDLARQVVALRTRVPRCTLRVAVGTGVGARDSGIAGAPRANVLRASAPSPVAGPRAASARAFTVQVAAYDTRAGAESLAGRLVKRGIETRVEAGGPTPDTGPYRVRIGRFATRAEAVAAQRKLQGQGIAGFVVEEPNAPNAEPRP